MTLAGISEFIGKHTNNLKLINNFFYDPRGGISGLSLNDIGKFKVEQYILNTVVNKFLSRTSSTDISFNGPTLAEIKSAIDKQKRISEIIDTFFEGSKPQDFTMRFSDINWYISDQDQLEIRAQLNLFLFNTDYKRIMTGEIKANYLDIYRDISNLKEKVKILHPFPKNIVYTVGSGTMDWIKDTNVTLFISIAARGPNKWISGIYLPADMDL